MKINGDYKTSVSVIIAAYNHENYVADAILSIVDQTFDDIELLVIDDGSTDKTWDVIVSLKDICEKRFSNVYFGRQENHGTCYTINELLKRSAGKYIFGLASDDIVHKDAISSFYNFLESNDDYALVVGENMLIDKRGEICYWNSSRKITYKLKDASYISFSDYLEKSNKAGITFDSSNFGSYQTLILGNYIPNGYLVRRDIYKVIGSYSDEAPLEDYWLMLQISKYYKMKFLRQTTFYYRWHDTNSVKDVSRMQDLTDRTIRYEYKLLVSKFKDLHNHVNDYFMRHFKKKILDIGFIKIYKTRSIENKFFYLEICGHGVFVKYKTQNLLC